MSRRNWRSVVTFPPGLFVVAVLLTLAPTPGASAQAPVAAGMEEPVHAELRKLRETMVEAIRKNDLDAIVANLDEDVVVTWQDGTTTRKPQGVREYYERMTKGPDRIVERVEIDPKVDELTHFYGDTGVAAGSSRDLFVLTDGRELTFDTRWTATVVKKQGQWKLASFHVSTSAFDNPVLKLAITKVLTWSLGIGVPFAIVIGVLIGRWWTRRAMTSTK
jgi:ketosteroid isomerase-like protein